MFDPQSYHSCDNFLFGVTTTAAEELVIRFSIAVVATYVQLVVGRIVLY